MRSFFTTLIFLISSLSCLAQDGFYVGLGVGTLLPLGENRTSGTLLNPISIYIQDRGSFGSLSLSGGFFFSAKQNYDVLYRHPTDQYTHTYDFATQTFHSVRHYEEFVSKKNTLSGMYGLLEYEAGLLGSNSYQLGGLVSLGASHVSFGPEDNGLKDREDLDKNEKTRFLFAIGVQNSFFFEGNVFQISLQYWVQNPTLERATPSLKGNYLALRLSYAARWFNFF